MAAPGTDPDQLAAVVARLAQPGTTARSFAASLAATRAEPSDAVRAVLATGHTPMLDDGGAIREGWYRVGVRVALPGDPGFPDRLIRAWPDPDVPVLWAARGPVPSGAGPAVAIVGARRATGYGTGVAAWLAEAASRAGATVVSGGALGVDAAAHAGALDGPGGTTVVLGCGHAVPYPRPHARPDGLFGRVLLRGGSLCSEHLPDQPPRAHAVRARNRLVAGLADVVVVVEGGARSGALVTAEAAAVRDIPVLAVPGDVRRPTSAAPHRLLAEGAAPCTSPADLLDALRVDAPPTGRRDDGRDDHTAALGGASELPGDLRRTLAAAWPRPVPVDDLAGAAGAGIGSVLAAVTRARVAGEVVEGPGGIRLARPP